MIYINMSTFHICELKSELKISTTIKQLLNTQLVMFSTEYEWEADNRLESLHEEFPKKVFIKVEVKE